VGEWAKVRETRRENRPPTPGISPKIDIFQHILTTKPLTNFTHLKIRSKDHFQQCRISTISGDNTTDPAALHTIRYDRRD